MTLSELTTFLNGIFPQVEGQFQILEVMDQGVSVRMNIGQAQLRPGGTISGPSIFALADIAFYLATLSFIGPKALTVTTNCSIDFMRKPEKRDLIAVARVLKLGKSLSVGDVMICTEGTDQPVARASLTYSIPPRKVG